MIKIYSNLDRKGRKGYGRRRMRKDLVGCYLQVAPVLNKCCAHCGSRDDLMSARIKESTREKFVSVLPHKVIDGIFDTIHRFYSSSGVNSNNTGVLAHNVIKTLADVGGCFQNNIDFQKDHVHSSFAKLSVSPTFATPRSTAKMFSDKKITVSAPSVPCPPNVPAAKKVKSRLIVELPVGHDIIDTGGGDIKSPVGRLMYTPSSTRKDPMKAIVISSGRNVGLNTPQGSKEIPIPIGDTTPKSNVVQSLDVSITGTSTLKEQQEKLARDNDSVYNRVIEGNKVTRVYTSRKPAPTPSSQADEIHVLDDTQEDAAGLHNPTFVSTTSSSLIILQPKNHLQLPLQHNPRFPVSDEEIMHYCAIVDIPYMEGIQNFVSLGQTLMPNGHIDTFLIPCFCRKLFEDFHPRKAGRHYFFSYIGESILKYDTDHGVTSLVRGSFLGAASASKGRRLASSDRLFFPICHEDHWFTFCVDFKWKLFVFLDSYFSPQSEYQRSVRGRLMNNFIALWHEIFPAQDPGFNNFKLQNGQIPMQGNPHDCGVMTMMAMEFYDPLQDLNDFFSQADIPHIRIRYANRLFFHPNNETDRSLVTNHYDKDAFMRRLHRSGTVV